METLNNFASIYCFIAFVIGAVFMLAMLSIAAMGRVKEPRNKVHFYVARDKCGMLWLYLSKPVRGKKSFRCNTYGCVVTYDSLFENLGLDKNGYKDLKWEDEPVEAFLDLED